MPTVSELKYSLSSGGDVVAPVADSKVVPVRDRPPLLIDHNEAEWESTMEFLHREQRRAALLRKQEAEAPAFTGSWNVMHDKARDDDGQAIKDCVEGKNLALLKPVDDVSEGGWSALHVAGVYNSALAAAAAIDSNGDVLLRDVYGWGSLPLPPSLRPSLSPFLSQQRRCFPARRLRVGSSPSDCPHEQSDLRANPNPAARLCTWQARTIQWRR